MEKSISSNGIPKPEDRKDRNSMQKDESIVKAVENSNGTSDKALKEAANDPATHAPGGVKRKEVSDTSDSSSKRVKTESGESEPVSLEDAKVDASPPAASSRKDISQDSNDGPMNGLKAELPLKPPVKEDNRGEESEEGELDE
ncbi:hypothetical protein M7I_2664 [Glarea lozoyensis 74030]|nr:hypothetical protein M7I_2664 [Glarea lozoyensis 74030]